MKLVTRTFISSVCVSQLCWADLQPTIHSIAQFSPASCICGSHGKNCSKYRENWSASIHYNSAVVHRILTKKLSSKIYYRNIEIISSILKFGFKYLYAYGVLNFVYDHFSYYFCKISVMVNCTYFPQFLATTYYVECKV